MKRILVLFALGMWALTTYSQRCAVLEFKAGAGISQSDVDGISGIFLTYFRPEGYTMVERTQIDKAIEEQGFQRSSLTENQMVRIGQILNVSKIVVGDINVVFGEYNIDARVINVETGTLSATDGISVPKGSSYRSSMQKLAEGLASKIAITTGPTVSAQHNSNQQSSQSVQNLATPTILYGYLKVFPHDLGTFDAIPASIIERLNNSEQYGYNTWRVPTREEIQLLAANGMIGSSDNYLTSDGNRSGVLRLVTDQEIASVVNKERKEKEEFERIEKAENDRIAAEKERLDQAYKASLSGWEKAYIAALEMGYEIYYEEIKRKSSEAIDIVGNGTYRYVGNIYGVLEGNLDSRGWKGCEWELLKTFAKNKDIDAFLKKYKYWWGLRDYGYDNYDDYDIPLAKGGTLSRWSGEFKREYIYESEKQRVDTWYIFGYPKFAENRLFGDNPPRKNQGYYWEDLSYPAMFYKKLSPSEATAKIDAFYSKRMEEIREKDANDVVQKSSTQQMLTAVDLGLSVKWGTCNIGAYSPEEYGDYYSWAETNVKLSYTLENYKYRLSGTSYDNMKYIKYNTTSEHGVVDNKNKLELSDDVVSVKCGGIWRIPTDNEFQELMSKCSWTWTTYNGVKGYLIKSKVNDNSIFLPAAGNRDGTNLINTGNYGLYWSSTLYIFSSCNANCLIFNSSGSSIGPNGRHLGYSIRPVCP